MRLPSPSGRAAGRARAARVQPDQDRGDCPLQHGAHQVGAAGLKGFLAAPGWPAPSCAASGVPGAVPAPVPGEELGADIGADVGAEMGADIGADLETGAEPPKAALGRARR